MQILAAAPGAVEHFGYGLPGFKLNGHPLVYFGAAKHHCAIYGANTDPEVAAKLRGYKQSKGTIQFTPDKPIPPALVKAIVKARVAANAKKWGVLLVSGGHAEQNPNHQHKLHEQKKTVRIDDTQGPALRTPRASKHATIGAERRSPRKTRHMDQL